MKIKNQFFTVFFLGVCLLVFGCTAQAQRGEAQIEKMTDFTLKDVTGKNTSLDSVLKANKAVLVNFWATWCPPCRAEIPGLIDLQKKYGASGFTVLGIDIGESGTKVSNFMQKIGINYPVLLDADQSVAEGYRVVGIPTSYLVASDGKVLGEYHAYTPELVADVESAIK